jgi:hypothetical protein
MTKWEEIAATALEVDPDRSNIIVCIGKKGFGKSEAARSIFDAWPYDRVVIDVTGDARPDDPSTIVMTAPWPAMLPMPDPEGLSPHRVTAWARVDPRSATYEHDQDSALGLGLYPKMRNILVWVDEYGQMATANKIGPNLKLALQSSRHYHLTMLLCFPRAKFVPVITLMQADKVLIYRTPIAEDRQIIAQNIGYPFKLFEQRYQETMRRGRHAFLLWDAEQSILLGCPELPLPQTHGPRS